MPEASAGMAAKHALSHTRKLLFPFSAWRWLAYYLGPLGVGRGGDPLLAEMRRLKPYYRGTRLLTLSGLLLVLLAFVLPFSVVFVGIEGFGVILIAYVLLFVTASLVGMALQSAADGVFALQYERKQRFADAVRLYVALVRAKRELTVGYMAVKMLVDLSLSTLALAFFLPALLLAMALMMYVTSVVRAGADVPSGVYAGLLAVILLAALGFVATLLLALPAAAFYGYYTEEAVRLMGEAPE